MDQAKLEEKHIQTAMAKIRKDMAVEYEKKQKDKMQ